MRTINTNLGILLNLMIISVVTLIFFNNLVFPILIVASLLLSIMFLWAISIKLKDGKILPPDSIVHKNYYEIHLQRSIISDDNIAVLYWFKDVLMTLKSLEGKKIVFEVSEQIVNERNIRKIFGKHSVEVSEISPFAKLVVFELKLISFVNPSYWLKPKFRIRRKNIKRYVVNYEAVDWVHSIDLISKKINKFEKH